MGPGPRGAVHLADGGRIPCDAVVPCLGFAPSPVASDWRLPTDARGRAIADATLRVAPALYAAGDAITLPSMPWLRSGCASAMPLGAHAARSILADLAGEPPPPFRYGWTQKTIDLGGTQTVLQRLAPDGRPLRASAGVGPAAFKALLIALATRLPRWEAATGRALYTWPAGPRPAVQDAA